VKIRFYQKNVYIPIFVYNEKIILSIFSMEPRTKRGRFADSQELQDDILTKGISLNFKSSACSRHF
jgi:hypothetical protein